jgi:hypothetical protein
MLPHVHRSYFRGDAILRSLGFLVAESYIAMSKNMQYNAA